MPELTKILLVDDNPEYLTEVLPYYGYDLTCARDGHEALEILNAGVLPDIILLDIMMPNSDGRETLKKIRKTDAISHIPVIMVTAAGDDREMITGLRNGADDYIVKPFILPNLLARIEAVLRRTKYVNPSENVVKSSQSVPAFGLTDREKEVLRLVATGESNKAIAEKLVLSQVTVKSHLNSIFKKLNVKNRTQAVLLSMQTDL